jgi:hypothetical protein
MIKDIMNYDCCDQNLSISESKNQKINFNLWLKSLCVSERNEGKKII